MTDSEPLLSVRNLEKHYPITEGLLRREVGTVRAVDGVSFDVRPGEAVGLVGESGCGKSTTARASLRLEEPTGGEIRFDGADVRAYDDAQLRRFRRRAQLVLQDPDSAFNPRLTVGEAVAEPLSVHGLSDRDRRRRVVEDALERVGLSADDADGYPHEFSGGEKQRIALARALVLNPDLIVADEPVSALDGRAKGDVLGLLADLRREFDVAVLLISHDVDVVRRFCDRVAVMYLGRIVERGPVERVFDDPRHPYTRVLLSSVPSLDPNDPIGRTGPEAPTDEPPDASDLPACCRFHPRCPAIVPPDEVDLPREQWLGVVSLRLHLDPAADADAFRASLPAAGEAGLRARFDLPERLADPAVDEAVSAAAAAVEAGDLAAARERLAEATTSVCERESPALTDAHADRPVACHRFDPSVPGEPETGVPVRSLED
ncbi:oligopeptide/dipeptide ABC transporter ATP-binding protein [Salinilacihabitans rarus]|uniref:oligopeptide/dipeptide ABC transporter ATP-binding protein n=1 Tax=Salinilacihabitans rarus TaxID=2961596 RepID=UPI0020C8C24F|nr:oligopeptide/dipeptide ABC transporter ATP-binding protein [Salinilacihabitans rarus]